MVVELRLLLRSKQSYDRREMLALIEIEQYFAIVRIPNDCRFRFLSGCLG